MSSFASSTIPLALILMMSLSQIHEAPFIMSKITQSFHECSVVQWNFCTRFSFIYFLFDFFQFTNGYNFVVQFVPVPIDHNLFCVLGSNSVSCCRVVHNFWSSWQKFLSSRIVIIDSWSQSLLWGSGGPRAPCPEENFYVWSPQKRSFLDSEHKFPIILPPN